MTRGRIYLCDNSKVWYKTIQYLSDMYLTFPEGHGNKIISAFVRRQIRNHNDLLKYTVKSYKEWFDKDVYDEYDKTEIVESLWNIDKLVLNDIYDDYSYILNCSGKEVSVMICGEEMTLLKDEMIILSYSDIYMKIKRSKGRKKVILYNSEIGECINALDFYNRMYLGQYNNIDFQISMMHIREDLSFFRDCRFTREKLYTAIRSRVFKDTNIAEWDLNGSLGIWCENTSDNAKCSYDIQQILRYNRAYACNPEGGITVDFNPPIIEGSLTPIECVCKKEKDSVIESIRVNSGHLQIMDDAFKVYYYFNRLRITDMFKYYTNDGICLEIASVIEKLYRGIQIDNKYINAINNLRVKFLLAGIANIEYSEEAKNSVFV